MPLLQDKAQATIILDSLKRFKGNHHFTIGHKAHELEISRVKVLAQPVGAYVNWLYDDQLNLRSNGNKAEVAVMDVGFYTLDLYAIANGQVSERHIGGAEVGVHRFSICWSMTVTTWQRLTWHYAKEPFGLKPVNWICGWVKFWRPSSGPGRR